MIKMLEQMSGIFPQPNYFIHIDKSLKKYICTFVIWIKW